MRLLRPAIVITAGILSALIFFRLSVLSGFDRVPGNTGDGLLIMGIVDHWRAFFAGAERWDTLPMFWPATGSLGYSDAFFLHGIVYSGLCACGIDQFYSYTATLFLQALAGFFLMYLLLRRFMNVGWPLALAISAIFVNLSAVQTADTHIQMHSLWLCPGIVMLGWKALIDEHRAVLWAALCGISLALLFFTVYYVPWFLAFYFCLCACVIFFAHIVRRITTGQGAKTAITDAIATIRVHRKALIAFAAAFAVGIIPFLALYVPVMLQNGAWTYKGIVSMLPSPIDLVNTGSANIVWGWMADAMNLNARENSWEHVYGVAPLTMLTFVATAVFLFRRNRRGEGETTGRIALVFAATAALCWILLLKIGDFSLWKTVFHLVPGAKALRAVFRFDVVLSFFVLLVIAEFFKELAATKKTLAIATLCVLLPAMFFEQFSVKKACDQISRKEQIAFIESIPAPPPEACVFYMAPSRLDRVGTQIAAFEIARRTGLATLNGYSGSWPSTWHLLDVDHSDYEELVREWLGRADATGLYKFDFDSMTWTKADFPDNNPNYKPGDDIVENDLLSIYGEGWSKKEFKGGAWSCGNKTTIVLPLEKPAEGTLRVTMRMQGFVPDSRHSQRVRIGVNGKRIADFAIEKQSQERAVDIPLPETCAGAEKLAFEFDLPDALSPASCGFSGDARKLGVCLFSFKVFREEKDGK